MSSRKGSVSLVPLMGTDVLTVQKGFGRKLVKKTGESVSCAMVSIHNTFLLCFQIFVNFMPFDEKNHLRA